jgi:glycosyltransferase involved in cell wall biosynthesis
MRVLLGPSHELHDGIHGALTDNPAPDIEYCEGAYGTCFQYEAASSDPFSPIHDHSECEWVRFDDEHRVDLIHSARFPVDTALPWVVDADCLLLPLQIGAFFALGIHEGSRRPGEAQVQRREAAMAVRYADPGCTRIMLRSERAHRQFFSEILGNPLIDPAVVAALAAKTEVVYPAVPASPPRAGSSEIPTILFMGRTFEDKGGRLAVAVLERLHALLGPSFRATVVSGCPPDAAERLEAIGVEIHATMPRATYLDRLAQADIFFSPTLFESFGMGLVEAAAAGAAIVTSSGPGMEHIGELFQDGVDARLVSNALTEDARVQAYVEALSGLIRDPPARRALAASAHRLADTGRLSLDRHNQTMSSIYAAAIQASAPGGMGRNAAGPGQTGLSRTLVWSERVCHWAKRRHTPPGGLRICL